MAGLLQRLICGAALVATTATALAATALYSGVCRVVAPQSLPFDCRAAAFGEYLPQQPLERMPRLALDDETPGSMTGCTAGLKHKMYRDSIVLVRRGGCVFQQKLRNIVRGGGVGMILINTDDSDLQLGSLEFERLDAVAVAVKRTEGDYLVEQIRGRGAEHVVLAIGGVTAVLDQAWGRIQHLLAINAPFVAYETFMDVLPVRARNTSSFFETLRGETTPFDDEDLLDFALRTMDGFNDQWEFTRDASLHAAIVAAACTRRRSPLPTTATHSIAMKLMAAGYYVEAATVIKSMLGHDDVAGCLHAFTLFLQGDVSKTAGQSQCLESRNLFNVTAAGLDVPRENFLRLAAFDLSEADAHCLDRSQDPSHRSTESSSCCQRQLQSRDNDPTATPRLDHEVHRRSYSYRSSFVEELFHSLNIMGVFMDEVGAFQSSLHFFHQAARLCEDWSLSLELREALAIPIVFDSVSEMAQYMNNVTASIANLQTVRQQHERVLSSLTGSSDFLDFFSRPEDATYLRYTITPSTMFVGYQGYDMLPLQRSIFSLRSELFPSLRSPGPPRPHRGMHESSDTRRRIAFVSTWFRNHSVGKLILGVISQLDRSKFHVLVYRAAHFLPYSEEWTKRFRDEADSYMELPVNQEDALALLYNEAIDILVYPELGMDAWMLLMAHHRVAPVQCIFWGHPITTANPAIDYFISSEYFIADFFEGRPPSPEADLEHPGRYHGSSFSEQVVLFRGLSTFFTNPSSRKQPRSPFQREMLHLPANRRLYVCPQTLMKLHPRFDLALRGILDQDGEALIILLSSDTQRVWKEQLRRRFQRSLGEHHQRVIFFSTLPYDSFMGLLSTADVILDPFPFGGGVTTLDALAVGAPVVTLPTAQTVPELAAGFLRYVGITDTIVLSVDDYVATAIRIAQQADVRRDLSNRIRAAHHKLYEDEATLDDWNTFLGAVEIAWPESPR